MKSSFGIESLHQFLQDAQLQDCELLYTEAPHEAQLVDVNSLKWSASIQRGFGHSHVYRHQVIAYEYLQAGKNIIITTPTASGKTGAFFPALFERLHLQQESTALLIYPLVALGQDQRDKLLEFNERGQFHWNIGAFQGNATVEEVVTGARMLTATPDKLHWSLTHPEIKLFLSRLEYLVLDEAHTYRGAFGCEVSGLIRRILDLAHSLGAHPQVILSTATIGNAKEFARELTGLQFEEISESGAPRHGKEFYLVRYARQPRRFWDSLVKSALDHEKKLLVFFKSRAKAASLYSDYSSQEEKRPYIHLYMAGMSDREGRLQAFRKASYGVMFATNALEAGVDIGDLEIVVIDGYPSSRMAFRQMAGRAGRVAPGMVLFAPAIDSKGIPQAADEFYSNKENFYNLMTGPIEKAVIKANNPYIYPKHQERRKYELQLDQSSTPAYWSLRGERGENFFVVHQDDYNRMGTRSFKNALESLNEHYARIERHPDALFRLEGNQYKVIQWIATKEGMAILVEDSEKTDLFTKGLCTTQIISERRIPWKEKAGFYYSYTEVCVHRAYKGYSVHRRISERVCLKCDHHPKPDETICECGSRNIRDIIQNQLISTHFYEQPIYIPPFHTIALEIGINPAIHKAVAVSHTLKHIFQKLIPEYIFCDENDIAGTFNKEKPTHFYIYDNWQGGLGITQRAYEQIDLLLNRAYELSHQSCCFSEKGCYKCVATNRCFSPMLTEKESRPIHKQATATFLETVISQLPQPVCVEQPTVSEPVHDSWPLRARELVSMYGLTPAEVSARLGISTHEIEEVIKDSPPLRIKHPRYGEGILIEARGSDATREVLIHFETAGKKRLVLSVNHFEVIDENKQELF